MPCDECRLLGSRGLTLGEGLIRVIPIIITPPGHISSTYISSNSTQVVSVYVLWRIMFNAAGFFINIENSIIEWQFILLSMAVVALSGVYLRARLNINPDAVYRKAMLRLNTNPAVLQRMGAPLVGSEVRATVTTGGNFKFGKRLLPKWQAKRTQMIFPLTGADRRGLVSVEAKKWKGTIVFKLLTVDVRDGRDESRVYLEGDSSVYNRGGVMRELRDPFLHALESEAQFAAEDEIDEAEEDRREDEEKARRRPKALEAGGGMFFYERIYYAIRSQIDHLRVRLGRA